MGTKRQKEDDEPINAPSTKVPKISTKENDKQINDGGWKDKKTEKSQDGIIVKSVDRCPCGAIGAKSIRLQVLMDGYDPIYISASSSTNVIAFCKKAVNYLELNAPHRLQMDGVDICPYDKMHNFCHDKDVVKLVPQFSAYSHQGVTCPTIKEEPTPASSSTKPTGNDDVVSEIKNENVVETELRRTLFYVSGIPKQDDKKQPIAVKQLMQFFKKFGPVLECRLVMKKPGKHKGIGFVIMNTLDGEKVLREASTDQLLFCNQALTIRPDIDDKEQVTLVGGNEQTLWRRKRAAPVEMETSTTVKMESATSKEINGAEKQTGTITTQPVPVGAVDFDNKDEAANLAAINQACEDIAWNTMVHEPGFVREDDTASEMSSSEEIVNPEAELMASMGLPVSFAGDLQTLDEDKNPYL